MKHITPTSTKPVHEDLVIGPRDVESLLRRNVIEFTEMEPKILLQLGNKQEFHRTERTIYISLSPVKWKTLVVEGERITISDAGQTFTIQYDIGFSAATHKT